MTNGTIWVRPLPDVKALGGERLAQRDRVGGEPVHALGTLTQQRERCLGGGDGRRGSAVEKMNVRAALTR